MTTEPEMTTAEKDRHIREAFRQTIAELTQGLNVIDAQSKRGQMHSIRESVTAMRGVLQLQDILAASVIQQATRCTGKVDTSTDICRAEYVRCGLTTDHEGDCKP